MTPRTWLLLLALSLLWGGSFLFYRMLAFELPPLLTVFSRTAIGAASIALWLRAQGSLAPVPRKKWPRIAAMAVLNNVIPFTLFAWAETRVSGGTASILNAMTPICVLLVSSLVFRAETITRSKLVGIACGFAGVVVLVGPDALVGADLLGQAACLLATVSYGFALPTGKKITGIAPPVAAAAQLGAAAVMVLPLTLIFDRPWTLAAPSAAGWVAVAGLGVLSTGLAYVIFFTILAQAGATSLSLVTLLIPPSALLLGAVVLGEPVTWPALAGMGLIALGLAAIDGRLFRRSTA